MQVEVQFNIQQRSSFCSFEVCRASRPWYIVTDYADVELRCYYIVDVEVLHSLSVCYNLFLDACMLLEY